MSEVSETKRTYKDSLFRMIFQDREALLSLYNAINGTCYDQPEELIITTSGAPSPFLTEISADAVREKVSPPPVFRQLSLF